MWQDGPGLLDLEEQKEHPDTDNVCIWLKEILTVETASRITHREESFSSRLPQAGSIRSFKLQRPSAIGDGTRYHPDLPPKSATVFKPYVLG
jgi:hypothetical protein